MCLGKTPIYESRRPAFAVHMQCSDVVMNALGVWIVLGELFVSRLALELLSSSIFQLTT